MSAVDVAYVDLQLSVFRCSFCLNPTKILMQASFYSINGSNYDAGEPLTHGREDDAAESLTRDSDAAEPAHAERRCGGRIGAQQDALGRRACTGSA